MKKGFLYSFIALLLTTLCVASGVTYAYFTSNQNFKTTINNEEYKLDLSLSNLIVKEGEFVKDPNNLDCGFKVSIQNDILSIENGNTANMNGSGCDVFFDITVTNNTNTNLLYYYNYQLLNGKNLFENLLLNIDDVTSNKPNKSYVIEAHKEQTINCSLKLNDRNTYNLNAYFANSNEVKERIDIRFYTNAFLNNDDSNDIPYISNILDNYYGIHKINPIDQVINCFSLSEDCPFFVYSETGFKLEKINPDEDSFVKVEKIDKPQFDSSDNLLAYKISFNNLCFDSSDLIVKFGTYIPNFNAKFDVNKDSVNSFINNNYFTSNLTNIKPDNNLVKCYKNIIYTEFGYKYGKDSFVLCPDEYKELFTTEFYFYEGGL